MPRTDNVLDRNDSLRSHLTTVYASLCVMLFTAAAGSVAHLYFNIGGTLTMLAGVGLLVLLAVDPDKNDVVKRLATMAAFGFFKGASIGPLIAYAAEVDPRFVVMYFQFRVLSPLTLIMYCAASFLSLSLELQLCSCASR